MKKVTFEEYKEQQFELIKRKDPAIHTKCEVENDVTLYQGVTLGGTGKEKGKRHPTLGNNVLVGAGAKVLGSITIGNNVKIGAGSVVVKDVPSDTTVVGIPAKIVKGVNAKIEVEDLDQVDMPDPIVSDIDALKLENEELKRRIAILEKKFAEL